MLLFKATFIRIDYPISVANNEVQIRDRCDLVKGVVNLHIYDLWRFFLFPTQYSLHCQKIPQPEQLVL